MVAGGFVRVSGGPAGVRVGPIRSEEAGDGVRVVVERVVGAVGFAGSDSSDFALDTDDGVAEALEFAAVFGFRGLNH
jgi:hypothetical protein